MVADLSMPNSAALGLQWTFGRAFTWTDPVHTAEFVAMPPRWMLTSPDFSNN
jgi:hypothetical protein